MLVDSGVIERTQAFYDWELRGRGWDLYPHPVPLEPPFVPPRVRRPPTPPPIDDTKKETWLSSIVASFRKPAAPAIAPSEEEPPEAIARQADAIDKEEFVVFLPENGEVPRAAIASWLGFLSPASNGAGIELLSAHGRTEVRLSTATQTTSHVTSQLRGALPAAIVAESENHLSDLWNSTEGRFAAVEFGLGSEFMVPLAIPGPRDEPMLPLIAALDKVNPDELGLVQVLFEEVDSPWAESIHRAVTTPGGQPFFADAPEITKSALEKTSSRLFAVVVRLAAIAPDGHRAEHIVRSLAAGLSQFGNPQTNELIPLPIEDPSRLEQDIVNRTTHRSGMILNTEELASLVKLPGRGVVVASLARALPGKAAPWSVRGRGVFLGENSVAGETADVRLSERDRLRHTHVIGASGTGKSTLMVNAILQDVEAGRGVAVLDPHGDLIDEILGRVPEHRTEDVILFDPSDPEYVTGVEHP